MFLMPYDAIRRAADWALANDTDEAKSQRELQSLRSQVNKLAMPTQPSINLPQTALGLLLAAFDHKGNVSAGYMSGLQTGWAQEYGRRQDTYQRKKQDLESKYREELRNYQRLSGMDPDLQVGAQTGGMY